MLKIEYTNQFKRDLHLAKRRNKDIHSLIKIMRHIENEDPLSPRLKNHSLTGNWRDHLKLHIAPDWLLIYKIIPHEKTVIFVRTGTHADLF